MLGNGGVDPAELAALTRELEASGYHRALQELVKARIAALLVDDVTTAHVAMKRRGQLEELGRLTAPLFVQALALHALAQRAEARARAGEAARPVELRRDWWSDPVADEPVP